MSVRASVCIATWNGEKHIQRQLESILKQLGNEDEVIISDDGSTDQTLKIITNFNDPRIHIVKNTGKHGPVNNFQNALIKARGKIIFLSDQDDEWLPTRLEKHIEHHKNNDLVMSDARVVDSAGDTIYPSFFKQRGSKIGFYNNIKRNSYIGCCMSFNEKILHLTVPFPSYIHMHDWWIGLVSEIKGQVHFIDEPLLKYTRHGNNASPTLENSNYSTLKRLKNRLNLLRALINVLFK